MTVLTVRFDEAFEYTHAIHRDHTRRGVPMIAHLMAVAATVLEWGGNEDEAIGALLHDAAEEAGGRERVDDIRKRFGEQVAGIVEDCTDSFEDPPPSWRKKKEQYVAHVEESGRSANRVSAADKLCNVRQLIRDLRTRGPAIWDEYEGGKEGRLWYYGAVLEAFKRAGSNPLVGELEHAVSELRERAG
jgi:(p)ppGpp synthase/HD superfamily hydrolase